MKLNDFLAQSIIDIMDGVMKAQAHAAKIEGALVNPSVRHSRYPDTFIATVREGLVPIIDYDISVTINDQGSLEVAGGIMAGVLGIGTKGKEESQETSLNRLKFSIPIALPKQGRVDTSSKT